jgi:membrane protease YdiL (CAAX protease family)
MVDYLKPIVKPGLGPRLIDPDAVVDRPAALADSARHTTTRLALETAIVTVGAVAGVRFLNVQRGVDVRWLAVPCLLVSGALVPTWLRKADFPPICPDRRSAMTSVALVCIVGICVMPAVLIGLWLASRMHLPILVRPVITGPCGWLAWLVYQFLYVAIAEELFFRGYLQANLTRLLAGTRGCGARLGPWTAAVISAGGFAVAHVVVQGRIASLLTFLPGLIFAWLFIRTRSLLAPILFHGLANVCYGIIALTLT